MIALDDGQILSFRHLDARIEPFDWAFAAENRDRIAAHWQGVQQRTPAAFNGRIMLQHRARLDGDRLSAGYFETDYSSFLAWRDARPAEQGSQPVRNGFSMAALRSADGAFLCGRMGAHTVNAGKVYFAAGTPDPDDLRADGTVDLAGSVVRELGEETGLTPADIAVEDRWHAVVAPGRVAFMRPVTLPLPAEEARRLMRDRMAALHEQELDDIVVIRKLADCEGHDMAPFMAPYLAFRFAEDD